MNQKVSLNKIFSKFQENQSNKEIYEMFGLSDTEIERLKKVWKLTEKFYNQEIEKQKSSKEITPGVYFGYKNESYYTEEEMLKGINNLVKEDLNKRHGEAL